MYRAAAFVLAGTRSLITTRDDWALSETGRRGYINLNRRRAFAMFGVYEHTRAQPVIIGKEKERERESERSTKPHKSNRGRTWRCERR